MLHESKIEEMIWFHLLPFIINDRNKQSKIKISVLNDSQTRIWGKDALFYFHEFTLLSSKVRYHTYKEQLRSKEKNKSIQG